MLPVLACISCDLGAAAAAASATLLYAASGLRNSDAFLPLLCWLAPLALPCLSLPACSSRDADLAWEKLDGFKMDGARWKVGGRDGAGRLGGDTVLRSVHFVRPQQQHLLTWCQCGAVLVCFARVCHAPVCPGLRKDGCPPSLPLLPSQVDWAIRKDFDFFGWKWTEGPSRSPSRSPSPK